MDFLVRARFLVSQATLSRKNGPSGNGVSVPAVPFSWRSRESSTFGIAPWLGLFPPSMKKRIKAGGVRSIPFGPKLFVGVVVGDCVQILGGAWAIRLGQLSLGLVTVQCA